MADVGLPRRMEEVEPAASERAQRLQVLHEAVLTLRCLLGETETLLASEIPTAALALHELKSTPAAQQASLVLTSTVHLLADGRMSQPLANPREVKFKL